MPKKPLTDGGGITPIEIGLILVLLSVAIIAILTSIECDEFGSNCQWLPNKQTERSTDLGS